MTHQRKDFLGSLTAAIEAAPLEYRAVLRDAMNTYRETFHRNKWSPFVQEIFTAIEDGTLPVHRE